ncbi:uncharacterized protein [Montipora capricornis]|uniref:uncharacterized protein isoform X1 n=1 Tax=Montipora capricornis TaxID=246305 RepID=UPI0035F1D6A5
MALTPLVSFAMVGFAAILTANANVPYIEDEATAMQKEPAKRWHNGNSWTWHCTRYCSHQSRCSGGYRCYRSGYYYYRCCKWLRSCTQPGHWCLLKGGCCVKGYTCRRGNYGSHWYGKCVVSCSSDESCPSSQCCANGVCSPKKKPNEYCRLTEATEGSCCVKGFTCKRYGSSSYGKCVCNSDASCPSSKCCAYGACWPKKQPNDYCLLTAGNCCVQGYECKPAGVGQYWGKCVEESGSGLGENIIS